MRTVSCNTVNVVRPRKSIFSRPMRSSAFMSYWVVTSSRLVLYRGTMSVSGRVSRGMTGQSFEAQRDRHQIFHALIGGHGGFQLRSLRERGLQLNAECC